MQYEKIITGDFLSRPNRFIARVLIDGQEVSAHVKNTGRCRELLVPGAKVYLEDFRDRMGKRSLAFSLIGTEKTYGGKPHLVNMDSQAPNKVVKEALESGALTLPGMGTCTAIRPEVSVEDSRLDFFVQDAQGQEGFIEVKGVTLETDGIASFPDAPTERGIKHLKTLSDLVQKGYNAYVLFVIQMTDIAHFTPNEERHFAFAEALRAAKKAGVQVLAYDCTVTADTLVLNQPIPVSLD